jgi:hypothetical protein
MALADFIWYQIVNYNDFVDLDLPSQEFEAIFTNIGLKDVLITKGNLVSMLYEGVFLSCELNDQNPFEFDGHAIWRDENDDLWLGIAKEEEEE